MVMSLQYLVCGDNELDLSVPQLMGVLNITPDSFSDGGELYRDNTIQWSVLMARAQAMSDAGAKILDVGGESTRPRATPVSSAQELDRVVPVIEKLRANIPAIISVDTSKPEVIREAAAAGAGFINDVRALRIEGALEAVALSGLPVCLTHIGGSGDPIDMQDRIDHQDKTPRPIIKEINEFFHERVSAATLAGISPEALVLDPGFGFGKRDVDNLRIINELNKIGNGNHPLLIGVSRKSTIGRLLEHDKPIDRIAGGLTLVAKAVQQGVAIIRTHDIVATADMLKTNALLEHV